jgi:hypothetical protein
MLNREQFEFITRSISHLQPRRVLEIGKNLYNFFPKSVYYIQRDILEILSTPSIESMPFDLILCCEQLQCCDKQERLAARLLTQLSDNGGLLIITMPGPKRSIPEGLAINDVWQRYDVTDLKFWFQPHTEKYGRHTLHWQYGRERQDLYCWVCK